MSDRRGLGAGHSTLYANIFTKESRCTKQRCHNQRLPNTSKYNHSRQTVTVGSGCLLGEVERFCRAHGRRVVGMPEIADITVGGAVSVGAHGGGLLYGTMSSQIRRLWVYSKSGNKSKSRISVHNKSDLHVARCCVGILGVISHVEFHTRPMVMYRVQTRYCGVNRKGILQIDRNSNHSYLFTQFGNLAVTTVEEVYIRDRHAEHPCGRTTVLKNAMIDAYRATLCNSVVLKFVSFLICILPWISIILVEFDVATKVLFGTEVRNVPFSIVPSAKAYTLECGVDCKHADRAIKDFQEMLRRLKGKGHYVSYRSWCRLVKHDTNTKFSISSRSDVLAFEVTLDRQQTGHNHIISEFRRFRKKYKGRPHLGKTILKDDLRYVGKSYNGFSGVVKTCNRLGVRPHLTRSLHHISKGAS